MIEVQTSGSGNGDSIGHLDDYMSIISGHVDSLSKSLRQLSLKIHDNPEVRNKEFIAHEAITTYISQQENKNWEVTPSAYGIATAFVAVFDCGEPGPVVSFNAEYGQFCPIQVDKPFIIIMTDADDREDALTGLGHACGHNLIAVSSVGAALATAEVVMKYKLGGKVILFGTPAEGKLHLITLGRRIGKADLS